jgi:hypothetical protein
MIARGDWQNIRDDVAKAFPHMVSNVDDAHGHAQWCEINLGVEAIYITDAEYVFDSDFGVWTFGYVDRIAGDVFFFKNASDAVLFRMKWS